MQRDGKAFFQLSIVIACENKEKPCQSELGGSWKGQSQHSVSVTGGLSITDPTEESSTGKNHQLQAPVGKDVHCMSYKKLTTPATHTMRTCHHPQFLLFCNGLSFKTTSPNFLLLCHKISPSPLFVELGYGFAKACRS